MSIFERLGIKIPSNKAEGVHGWREAGSGEQPQETKAAELRERIQKLDEGIQAITASIDMVVGKIQEGSRVASQSGNESLKGLNARLEAEAQAEKLKLLSQRALFMQNKQDLEKQLGAL